MWWAALTQDRGMDTGPKMAAPDGPPTIAAERRDPEAPRIGLFGVLGSGNLGNDASMEVVLAYLRRRHAEGVVDAMCTGPSELQRRYGIGAVHMLWSWRHLDGRRRIAAIAIRALGKVVDPFRTLRWVRQHDLVIVPGMGVLDSSLRLRASGTPYAIFLLCASGWMTGTGVALVCVGADSTSQRLVRRLYDTSVRLASYRSFRDELSPRVFQSRGIDTSTDPVYTDLVFAAAPEDPEPGDPGVVAVGLMAYLGGKDERARADAISRHYLQTMTAFVAWLLDRGYGVRLVWGDTTDHAAVRAVLSGVEDRRSGRAAGRLWATPLHSLADVRREIAAAGFVVGTRFHTVLSALELCKPTIAVGYASKHDALMARMGVEEFALHVQTVELDDLVAKFAVLQARAAELRDALGGRVAQQQRTLEGQFRDLSALLETGRAPLPTVPRLA